jgi:hypothetical protein
MWGMREGAWSVGSLTTDMMQERQRAESILRPKRPTVTSRSTAARDGVVVGARFHFCGDEYRITHTPGDVVTATCGHFGTGAPLKRRDVAAGLKWGRDLSPAYRDQMDQRRRERNELGFKRQVVCVDRPRYIEIPDDDGHTVQKIGGAWPRRVNVDMTVKRPVVEEKAVTVATVDGKITVTVETVTRRTPAQKAQATRAANRRAQGYGTWDPSIG